MLGTMHASRVCEPVLCKSRHIVLNQKVGLKFWEESHMPLADMLGTE
jgi:hypothetical protein